MSDYFWHGEHVRLLVRSSYKRGMKRNALVQNDAGFKLVVPVRALRRYTKKGEGKTC